MRYLTFHKWVRKLTPSGYSDNGIWILSKEEVMIPIAMFDDPATVVETVKLFFGTGERAYERLYRKAWKVTNGNNHWYVDTNPLA